MIDSVPGAQAAPSLSSGPTLGKLERVEVRSVWPDEAQHFTPWLSEQLELLGEAIGLELEFEGREKRVGPFRADLLCKDTLTNSWVLIENQFGKTDHSHMGQLLTYAAGLEAVTVVWVAERFTDEHRAALDWLNRVTAEGVNFFGLEVELWRIGTSAPAPKFNVVSKPNEWARTVATAAAEAPTETAQLQLEFWQAFHAYASEHSKIIRPQKPHPQHWMDFAVGRAGFHLGARVHTGQNVLGTGLYISHQAAKSMFKHLEAQKAQVEEQIGAQLEWLEKPSKKRSQVELRRPNADIRRREAWHEQHKWLLDKLEAFHKAFSARIKALPDEEPDALSNAEAD